MCGLFSGFLVLPVQAQKFSDVSESHANYQAIEYLAKQGVVQGYGNGRFNPSAKINRAEFLKMLFLADEAKVSGENCFEDVRNDWFAPYVCAAQNREIVQGYSDKKFHPENFINFAEASKMLANFFELYTARSNASGWYAPYVLALEEADAIPAEIDSFDLGITRAEAAEMIWRIKTGQSDLVSNTYENIANRKKAGAEEEVDTTLKKFSSCDEAQEYISKNLNSNSYNYRLGYLDDVDYAMDTEVEESTKQAESAPTAGAIDSGDYSQTNVQVAGVDEADIVKTDGHYLYLVKDDSVRIIDANDPYNLRELSSVTFADETFRPSEMYLDGEIAVIIGQSYDWEITATTTKETKSFAPWYRGGLTKVYLMNIANKNKINLEREVVVEGYQSSSRVIDGKLYLVTNLTRGYYYPVMYLEKGMVMDSADETAGEEIDVEEFLPHYRDSAAGNSSKPVCACDEIYYPPYADPQSYLLVFAIPTKDTSKSVQKQVIMGGGNTIYASTENLYVAENTYNWYRGYSPKTVIYKFALGDKIEYVAKGKVDGTLLNQFSMDEYDGNLRVATTTQANWREGLSNNLFVLDSNMKTIGELTDLAQGEKIYSVRFMGKRGYMVTFQQIDPLFVLDLSKPTAPKVLGELKIPGVSDYIHPLDENHLIGFGLDTPDEDVVNETGWVWYQGVKIAMFDVSDVNNPKELYKEVIGDRGTSTPINSDHHALLFDANRGLMVVPITVAEIPEELKNDADTEDWTYGDTVFQGAYVYHVSVKDGFKLLGKITHFSENTFKELGNYYYGSERDISRVVRIGEYLYGISQKVISSWDLNNLVERDRVELTINPKE